MFVICMFVFAVSDCVVTWQWSAQARGAGVAMELIIKDRNGHFYDCFLVCSVAWLSSAVLRTENYRIIESLELECPS